MIVGRTAARRMVRGELVVIFKPEKMRPKVKAGQNYPIQPRNMRDPKGRPDPSIGRFRVKSVTLVPFEKITQDDSQAAGFSNRWDLRKHLETLSEGKFADTALFWRVEWEIIQVERMAA